MTRENIEKYILENYGCVPEYPWFRFPNYAVYRHTENRKWFAVVMDLPKSKLGINEDGFVDVMNVKCDPVHIGSLLLENGFYPAYHMNKAYWITILLDGSADCEQVKWLLNMSFNLTMKNKRGANC